jgi:hypothetical protein
MSTPRELAAGFDAASRELETAATTLPARVAAVALDGALLRVPRRSGALAGTGRVESDAAVFGGGVVDYAAPVNARTGFLDAGVPAAEDTAGELLEADVLGALALI